MRFLIEAHHPGDVHFWKYPVRELLARGHAVRVIGRDRDVMRRLFAAYAWMPCRIPRRTSARNVFPLGEMLRRQFVVAREILRFRPDVVASLFGSYAQSAGLLGRRNIIFTDSEFQHFNHRIAHPFADEIHTPYCFYKPLGRKQRFYRGIHELAFLDGRRFTPDPGVLAGSAGLEPGRYVVIRLSAWNTFHDLGHQGIGRDVLDFVNRFRERWRIVISAEENRLPDALRGYAMTVAPERFHDLLAFARFVLTEGASTASEAACLGVPTVYINSTEPRGYLLMLERAYGLVRNFREAGPGLACANAWLSSLDDSGLRRCKEARARLVADHCDVCAHVVEVLERNARG